MSIQGIIIGWRLLWLLRLSLFSRFCHPELRLNNPAKKMHVHPRSHWIVLALYAVECNRINWYFFRVKPVLKRGSDIKKQRGSPLELPSTRGANAGQCSLPPLGWLKGRWLKAIYLDGERRKNPSWQI